MAKAYMSIGFVFFLLTGCASDSKLKFMCPQVAIVRSLETIEDHGSDVIEESTLVGTARMQSVDGKCSYEDEGVDVTFNLNMKAKKGPRLGGNRISAPYFVSLVTPEDRVLGKEQMTAEFVFEEGANEAVLSQPMHVFIPLSSDEDGANYRVLSGFQLTEDQIRAIREKEEVGKPDK